MKKGPPMLIIALLAAILNVGTTGALLFRASDQFTPSPGPPEETSAPLTLWNFNPSAVDGMMQELKQEREKLDARKTELGKLEAHVKSEKAELEKVRADIETMRDQISQAIPRIEEAEAKNIKGLAKTYSAIKPSAAVAIFKEMNDNTVVKILSFMKAETAGAILGEMSKQQDKDESMAKRAARISDKLRLLEPLKKEAPQT